jgi:hypothetical protein
MVSAVTWQYLATSEVLNDCFVSISSNPEKQVSLRVLQASPGAYHCVALQDIPSAGQTHVR